MRNLQQHICVLIPTYNNAGTIVDVVRRAYRQMHDVIVVNDGSTDATSALLASLDIPVTVVTLAHNKGKGAALVAGFRKAKEMGYTHALTIDADGQHYPEDIPVLLRALDVHPNALIVGSRQFTDANMPGKSKFANRFSNFWFRLQTTVSLPDTQTGMRIYPLDQLYGLSILTSRYEAELELLVFAAWHNVPLVPVPIRVYYPPKEERVSHFVPARDFTRISILNCFLCIGALLFGYLNMYWRTVICFLYFGIVMLFIVNPLTLIYFAICGNNTASRDRFHRFAQRLSRHFVTRILGLHLTMPNDLSAITKQQSIIIANHQSFIDVVLCLSLSPKMVIVVKDYVWNNPIFAIVVRFLDCFPTSLDDEKREAKVQEIIEKGYSLFVFPEGTRSATGEIGRFHRGAFYYAEKYQLPIQPLLIEGMIDYMGKKQFALKPAHVSLTVLPPVMPDDTTWGSTYKKRAKSMELYYSALLHSNNKRVGIIGAGVGGLFTGALLAQKGYEVTLLEQLPVFGGGLYSYERNGQIWATGMHIMTGLQPQGMVTNLLASLDIHADCEPTTVDHSPATLIGETEWEQAEHGVFRFVGGSQKLANDLALYIVRHGGRVLVSQRITRIDKEGDLFLLTNDQGQKSQYDFVVSSLHPKQLLKMTDLPLYRPVARKRILTTLETVGAFKIYATLQPDTLPYDPVTHFIPEHCLLVMTPCDEHGQRFARTIETVMPMQYDELTRWHENRQDDYAAYEAFKRAKEQEVLSYVETIYPGISAHVTDIFSSTSLTYRDDYLSPEGGMFGMTKPVGSVRTRVPGFYITGQNANLHGLCGVAMTAQQTALAICNDC